MSRERRRKLMYDDDDLAMSELYFFISQLLRFSSLWIQESLEELRLCVEHFERGYFVESDNVNVRPWHLYDAPESTRHEIIRILKHNWLVVTSHQQELGNRLLDRIAKKQEEVHSLREAVSCVINHFSPRTGQAV